MEKFNWKHLKSGTDIRGVALEGVEGQSVDLTGEVVRAIAGAFVLWLSEKAGKAPEALKISIGRDSRLSGERIMGELQEVFCASGAKVYSCGLASTPAMFMSTLDLELDGAVQITASHHPWNRNGLKFFLPTGGLEGKNISEILALCEKGATPPEKEGGVLCEVSYMDTYCAHLRDMISEGLGGGEKPLEGFHVVVDAGNGAGGFYVEKVLLPLGADCTGSQFLEPDGRFPNHVPNPENKEAMASACRAVKESGAQLGIIFDTDVDRAGCVDGSGREINRNRLIALSSVIALEGNPGGTIVTDSITSSGLKTFIEQELGGVHLRFKRGYRNVIDKAQELNQAGINSPLAIETSGHAALRENYFLDDGAYLATKILILAARLAKEGKKPESLIEKLAEPIEAAELRFNILEEDFRPAGERILSELEAYGRKNGWKIADDSFEGIRVSFPEGEGSGWFLLRQSVHDPVMPLNMESEVCGGNRVIASHLARALEEEKALDLSPLKEFLA